MGYIMCGAGLSEETASQHLQEGKCNRDFRVTASDFQRKVVRHYSAGVRPPLEEAMWLLTSPENFQSRTVQECPPMQILAYLLFAECALYIHGPQPGGEATLLGARAHQLAQGVPAEVFSALAKAWPVDAAFQRMQASVRALRARVRERGWDDARPPFAAHVVLCRCAENVGWLSDLLAPGVRATFHVYEACADGASNTEAEAPQALAGLRRLWEVRASRAPAAFAGAGGECSAHGVLAHIARLNAGEVGLPAFTLFLPASMPEEPERRLLDLVFHSLRHQTLEVGFLPLGTTRSLPRPPTACERKLWGEAFGSWLPLGYLGARFAVSRDCVQRRPAAHYAHLLTLLEAPPPECAATDMRFALAPAWHAVFGDPAASPIRADDERLPIFLRVMDGPSGFQSTRLPKASAYLGTAAALVERPRALH